MATVYCLRHFIDVVSVVHCLYRSDSARFRIQDVR
jgi:hypothetical protein